MDVLTKAHLLDTSAKFHIIFFLSADCPLCRKYIPFLSNVDSICRQNPLFSMLVVREDNLDSVEVKNTKATSFTFNHSEYFDSAAYLAKTLHAKITPEVIVLNNVGTALYQGAIDNWSYETGKHRVAATEHYLLNVLNEIQSGKITNFQSHTAVGCFIE